MENVLVFPSGDGGLAAKVSDFGFALVDLDGSQPRVAFNKGTHPWTAPTSYGSGRCLVWGQQPTRRYDNVPPKAACSDRPAIRCALRPATARYFLSKGASPLCPMHYISSGKEYQDPPASIKPTDPSRTPGCQTHLHSCAKAGGSAGEIGQAFVDHLKPGYMERLTPAQQAALSTCAVEITLGEDGSGRDDPLLDSHDEYANKNAMIRGRPIIEHILSWAPAHALTALNFLVRGTHLGPPPRHTSRLHRPSNHCHGQLATGNWPRALADEFFNDVMGFMSPRHEHTTSIYHGYGTMRADGGPVHRGCNVDWD
ncbi:hypothetical protein QBC44DRAFT_367979 [Cladorrhinum sp. PSN332]|nr:hypothetical protein QBC44DRAFT_367979 [Cladorrhinum sp. PSN332]